MGSFSVTLSNNILNLQMDIDVAVNDTLFKFGTRLVEESPVGNPDLWESKAPPGYVGGHFRAQWQHGFNDAPNEIINAIDPIGDITIQNIFESIMASNVAGIHWFVNLAQYAQKLEDGHSTQAPAPLGIVRLSIEAFPELLERTLN